MPINIKKFLGEHGVAQSIKDAKDAAQAKLFGRDLTKNFKYTLTLNQNFQKGHLKEGHHEGNFVSKNKKEWIISYQSCSRPKTGISSTMA